MKKLSILLMILFIASFTFANTSNAELFNSEDSQFYAEFADLTTIENYVNANEGITINEISAPLNVEANLLSDMASSSSMMYAPPLGIPSFLWGCVFGVAGLAVVYFVDKDSDETKKALYGCVASTVVGTVLYFVLVASTVNAI